MGTEPTTSSFIIIALMISYEAKWEQVVGNYGGNQDVMWVQRFFPCLVRSTIFVLRLNTQWEIHGFP